MKIDKILKSIQYTSFVVGLFYHGTWSRAFFAVSLVFMLWRWHNGTFTFD